MTDLASAIYAVLRALPKGTGRRITYTDLIQNLPTQFNNVAPDSQLLATALGELVTTCRRHNLPAISAVVVRADSHCPGMGYYAIAHPDQANDLVQKMKAWDAELKLVRNYDYPVTI